MSVTPLLNLLDSTTLHVLLVVFLATMIRSAFGFGEALIAVPLLAFFIPLRVAAPLAVLLSITVAGVVVAQDWRKIHLRSAGWLVSSTLLGLPLGLLLLTGGHQKTVKICLAVLLFSFATYSLIGRAPFTLTHDSRRWLFGCGFLAGVLGGAYGMNGPPLVIYGTMRRWSAQQFRATLQGYFLPASILGLCGFWVSGLWVPAVTHYYLLSIPVALPAIFAGRAINHRLHGDAFMKYVYLGLAGIAVSLFIQTLRG
ncbi:MAG: sulfite exporter TauE/SafE family protein [Acidobacteria bacterium]|nr:sulfite exporter TauE/SafE family protein [Acidobacteriota bacterium]MBW4043473.1 sulfite exporter TauE/SafE family protein [Acidobacteriota bacterium]